MTQHTAAHTAGGVEDVVSARLAAAALWALQGPGALDVRTGVVYAPASPMLVTGTASTSPWTVTVNAGHVVGTKGSSNGPYYAANDGLFTVNLTVPPASNSRIDVIYAMQADSLAIVNADGSTAAIIAAATGTPGASPAVPAIPSGAVALAQVLITSTAIAGTSGAGVTITDVRQFTTTRGAPIPVTSLTDRGTITGYTGARAQRLDLTGTPIDTYTGGGWVLGDTGWIIPTLLNSWVNFSVAYAVVAYRRLNGIVYITGVIKGGASVAGQAIFNLPAGFRPNGLIMRGEIGASGTAAYALEIDGATGNVQQGAAGANPTWSVLDCNFPADA